MDYYAGIDVSLEASSLCVVDASGKIVKEAKLSSEPEALIAWFKGLPFGLARIGLEAGPLSQWLYAGLKQAGFAVELLETRHVRDAFKTMPVKTDRKSLSSGQPKAGPGERTRHCAADAAGLVQAGALQIGAGAGDARGSDRTQACAGKALRYRDEPPGHFAGLRPQGDPRQRKG